ncbi:MAG: 5-(carboxyamino)imidazole ribonucleotide mutase [Alphaproteobacteria bacterium]|nr:5-(carboxyamino)imidazole ribonucleotide mutase [Alphaproteobacteria bacterium]
MARTARPLQNSSKNPKNSAAPKSGGKGTPQVAIVMGSQSDWATMEHTAKVLQEFGITPDVRIVSAHRTPKRLYEFADGALEAGVKVIIAGAGGAAHLPGMVAALTAVPVLGVPVESRTLRGLDSLLSIAQMPAGIPVGTLAVGKAGAINAGLLAVAMLAQHDAKLAKAYAAWRRNQTAAVAKRPS